MKQFAIAVEDEAVAQKLLRILEHFKDEGVTVTTVFPFAEAPSFTDEFVQENWRDLAYRASGNVTKEDDETLKENYGKYLDDKHTL